VFFLLQPPERVLAPFLREQAALDVTYRDVGTTAGWGEDAKPPAGFHFHRATTLLGSGRQAFEAAAEALRRWREFEVGWAEVWPTDVPPEPGRVVAVRARVFGLWTLHACRVIYVIDDEQGPLRRYGFGYGTLPGHAETGEERFLVTWDRESDEVTYEVAAFVRPRHPLAVLAAPYAKRLADGFRRDSAAAMRRAVAGS